MAAPVPHSRGNNIPPHAEGLDREPSRHSDRSSERMYQRPEPHEKYHLDDSEIPEGMDMMWLPTAVAGQPNARIVTECYREGWRPSAAKDFARISGYGVEFPQEMIEMGLLENVKPDAPIVIDDQMLVQRPKQLSQRYYARAHEQAVGQVDNQMRRLRQASRGFRGTEIKRQHAPLPDSAKYDDE